MTAWCTGHARHWFAPYGCVGIVTPTCTRCGAPNPKYTPAVEAEMTEMGYGPDWWAHITTRDGGTS